MVPDGSIRGAVAIDLFVPKTSSDITECIALNDVPFGETCKRTVVSSPRFVIITRPVNRFASGTVYRSPVAPALGDREKKTFVLMIGGRH
jgi:hypothetical protein